MSVDTVSLWLKELLRPSGIDTSIFTAHSTRSISACKSKQVGLNRRKILKREQWTYKTTFETFYNKPTVDNSVEILKGKQLCLGSFNNSVLWIEVSEFYQGAKRVI